MQEVLFTSRRNLNDVSEVIVNVTNIHNRKMS